MLLLDQLKLQLQGEMRKSKQWPSNLVAGRKVARAVRQQAQSLEIPDAPILLLLGAEPKALLGRNTKGVLSA